MKHDFASAIGVATTALAAAVVMAFATETARADDITMEAQPFVSSTSRAEVRQGIVKGSPEQVRQAMTEWDLQQNQQRQLQSGYTADQSRAAYIKERGHVNALYAEDSGSNLPWVLKAPSGSTSTMGAPAR